MTDTFISDSIKYIGADDTTLDLFESQYKVPNGMAYNSYIILDEKVAVMDTIDKRKSEEWFNNLNATLNGRDVDYIVISHLEPDHAANIKALADKYPDAKLVLSAKAKAMLPQFFNIDNLDERCQVVAENDELSLGKHKLVFILHCTWRDCIIRRNIDLKRLPHSFQISFYHHPNARIIKFFHDFFY